MIIISPMTTSVIGAEELELTREERDKLLQDQMLAVALRSSGIVTSVLSFSKSIEIAKGFPYRWLYPALVNFISAPVGQFSRPSMGRAAVVEPSPRPI